MIYQEGSTFDEPIRIAAKFGTEHGDFDGWPALDDYTAWPRVKRHEPFPTLAVTTTLDGDDAFNLAWGAVKGTVLWLARSLTKDYDEQNDLIQIGMITLWLGDPLRYNFRSARDVRYVKMVLRNRMLDAFGMAENRFRKHMEIVVAALPSVDPGDPRVLWQDRDDVLLVS